MFLPAILHSFETGLIDTQINDILLINSETAEFGLSLTKEEVIMLIKARNSILKSCGRIELGVEATKQLIKAFCKSAYINEENYVLALNELHEIFYCLKNETEDKAADDELIEKMSEIFDGECHGSLELLKGLHFDTIVKYFKEKEPKDSLTIGGYGNGL